MLTANRKSGESTFIIRKEDSIKFEQDTGISIPPNTGIAINVFWDRGIYEVIVGEYVKMIACSEHEFNIGEYIRTSPDAVETGWVDI